MGGAFSFGSGRGPRSGFGFGIPASGAVALIPPETLLAEAILARWPNAVLWFGGHGVTAPAGVSAWESYTHPAAIWEQATEGSRPTFSATGGGGNIPTVNSNGSQFMTLNAGGLALLPSADNYGFAVVCTLDGSPGMNVPLRGNSASGFFQIYENGTAANDPKRTNEQRTSGNNESGPTNSSAGLRLRGFASPRNAELISYESDDVVSTGGNTSQNAAKQATTSAILFASTGGANGMATNMAVVILIPDESGLGAGDIAAVKAAIDAFGLSLGATLDA